MKVEIDPDTGCILIILAIILSATILGVIGKLAA